MDKAAIFIDGANISTTANVLGFSIDYQKLLNHFSTKHRILRSYFYTATIELPNGEINRRSQIEWLHHNGFIPRHKPSKRFSVPHTCPNCAHQSTELKIKGNMDIEMVVDMCRTAAFVDRIILFSGDGDFCALLRYLQEERGTQFTVVSTRKANVLSEDLRRHADEFLDLDDLRSEFTRYAIPRTPVVVRKSLLKRARE